VGKPWALMVLTKPRARRVLQPSFVDVFR